jgi:excisionase family DNA binding protein
MSENFLTVNELAHALKVPKSWVYSRTRETGPGSIPRIMVGKYIRFRLDDVMTWIERQEQRKSC